MSKIKSPTNGESILKWAKDVTREVNSLQPTASNGIKLSKNNAGTNYSLDKKDIPHADSMPNVIGGEVGEEILSSLPDDISGVYATTYSIESNPQNSFSLFGFGDSDNLREYALSDLESVDFIVRDRTPEGMILSGNTLRYTNFASLFTGVVPVEVQRWNSNLYTFGGARFRLISKISQEQELLYFPQVSPSMSLPKGAAVLAHKVDTIIVRSSGDSV